MNDADVVRRTFSEVWNEGRVDLVDQLYAADYVNHDTSGMPSGPGRDEFKGLVTMYRAGFPDVRMVVEDLMTTGDRVIVRWSGHGRNTGAMMGMPPTGNQVDVTGIIVHRMAGGKVAETWGAWDALSFLQQLGLAPKLG